MLMNDNKILRHGYVDWYVLIGVISLMFSSLAFVYSASSNFAMNKSGSSEAIFWNHVIRVGLAIIAMLAFSKIDYHWIEKFSKPILILAIGLLIYVFFDGVQAKGATRWIHFGFVSFQPSELAKFTLVFHLAVMLSQKKNYLDDFWMSFIPMMVWIVSVCVLIALQPNFSTMMVIFTLSMSMLFIGKLKLRYFAGVTVLGLVCAFFYAISAPYRMNRFKGYLGIVNSDSSNVLSNLNYQLNQGLIGFGVGKYFGVGIGNSIQRKYIPEPYGDFIYAIVGEEYGFVGAALILILFGLIIWRGFKISKLSPDELGKYLSVGITLSIGLYAIANAFVTTGLAPTTGLPMPFVSYGGSSIIISGMAVGVILNISQYSNIMPRNN